MQNSRKIFINTIIINLQTIISLLLTLYTSRIILEVLGIMDFGIYNIIGGVVTMFGFINNSMAVSNQRNFAYELGKQDLSGLNRLFNVSISIHFFISLIIFAFAETVGLWFFKEYINIPGEKRDAALWIYQFSVLSFMCNIMNVPFKAILNSYENMLTIAIISFTNNVLILFFVLLIPFIPADKLKAYSVLIFFSNFIILLAYIWITKSKYRHLKYYIVRDGGNTFKEMLSFASWNLSGSVAMVGKNQGIAIIMNIFIGPLINAAFGIANQVNSAVTSFSQAIFSAVNPQITKSYSAGNLHEMNKLIFQASKISFLFLLLISLPIILEPDFVLFIWLNKIPPHSSVFCILILVNALFEVLSFPLMTLAQATGKIKYYQLTNSFLLLMILPISYYLLDHGYKPYTILYVMILISIMTLISRLFFVKYLAGFNLHNWVHEVLLKVCLPTIITLSALISFKYLMEPGIIRFTSILTIDILCLFITSIIFSFNQQERSFVSLKIKNTLMYLKYTIHPSLKT